MSYRNGTYVAFHANGTNRPGGNSDIDYYNLMKAWTAQKSDDFSMCDSHEKTAAVRDSSSRERLKRVLRERLGSSKNMVLIIGETTLLDDDWVPFEIEHAVDQCAIPIIVAYVGLDVPIRNPKALATKWPDALKDRINNKTARAIHIPFKKLPLLDAIGQFSHNNYPVGQGLGIYDDKSYRCFGMIG